MDQHGRVTIVGGGIAGLTLAASLDPARWSVTLIEAEPDRATVGGGLALWPGATRVLRALGLDDLVDRHTGVATHGALRDLHTGRALVSGVTRLTMVPRAELLAALRTRVPATTQWEQAVVTDPADLDGDLVIGADGVRSAVRSAVRRRAAGRVPTSYLALRGLSRRAPDADAVGEYWGRGRLFGLVPVPSGAYWFTTHRSTLGPEPVDPAVALAEARDAFATAAPPVVQVLGRASRDQVVATRIWVAPSMRRHVRGRYVLIGDAAHAMMPNLGRGACDAIVDAATLAGALDSRAGLLAWQARRLPWTQAGRWASAAVMRLALSGAPQRLLPRR